MCQITIQIGDPLAEDQYLDLRDYQQISSLAELEEGLKLDKRYQDNPVAQLFLKRLLLAGIPVYLFRDCRPREKHTSLR